MVSAFAPYAESVTSRLRGRAPGETLLVDASGRSWTTVDCLRGFERAAAWLADLGVGPGDRVAVLQSLSVDSLFVWWGVDHLGAVYLPLNPSWTARLTGRVLADRRPCLLVHDVAQHAAATRAAGPLGVPLVSLESMPRDDVVAPAPPPAPTGSLDDCCIVHNSGRPGIHHGVRVSWRMFAVMGGNLAAQHPDHRVLVSASPCFFGTLVSIYGSVAGRGSVALLPGLDARSFWPAVRRAGVSFASLLNPSLPDLMAVPPDPGDRDHPLRLVTGSPARPDLNAAAVERFGIHWMAGLGKTEVCGAVATGIDPTPAQGVGRVLRPFEGRVVDPDGAEVAPGAPGELVLRSEIAGALPVGYADDPGATGQLWRQGWMHTGWHVSRDPAGHLHPVGNLSVHPVVVKREGYLFVADLEAEIVAVTAAEAARVSCRAPADPSADPEVIVWVTGDDLDGAALCADLRAGLPGHLVPDWIVPTDTLPERPDDLGIPAGAWSLSG